MKKILPVIAIALAVLASGCTQSAETDSVKARTACVLLCKLELQKGADLNSGPCLSNDVIEDGEWVCDVAHDPRLPVDNQPENQCPAYGPGKHFVEVDEQCNVIRVK
jgi:hypothetical protein